MNPVGFTLILGVASVVYGIYTLELRFTNTEAFAKLEAMKDTFGDDLGTVLHVVRYTVVPLAFGAQAIYLAMNGVSIF